MIAVIGEKLDIRRFKKLTTEGTIVSYVHGGGKIAVLVEGTGAEGDAVNEALKNVALQVASMNPQYISREDISAEEQEKIKNTVIESSLNDAFSLPKPILNKLLDKAVNDKVWSAEDIAAYEEQKNNKFLPNFISAEGSTFSFGAKTGLDRATGDGVGLFATNHTGVKATVPAQSNVFTNAFSADILIRLASIGRNYLSESGYVTGYAFNKIIIPGNCWQLEETIKRLIASDQIIASNNNDINTQKGKWTLVVDPLWQAATGKAPYILMSDEANKAYNGTVFYDRIGLDMKNEVDIHSRNLIYNGRARMSIGANNWRHVIMGGADVGTELS